MLIEKGFIDELKSEVSLYDLRGLKVIFVDTECDELAFNGTMYNKHRDNKGLPHMVEHCIFGGSLKFDFNEPFEYLVQNKRYTYLNAITFRDRTVCPFSTYSNKDFDEILEVYLDSIFNPYLRERTFRQECIRVEDAIINGIVYNEMLEMYGDKRYKKEDDLLSLFDCNYLKYNAHGNPKDLVNVSYNDMMDYYHNNFTRNNIVLSFYGKFDHEKYLNMIEEYSKLCNIKEYQAIEKSEKVEIKVRNEESLLDIVIAYQPESKKESELFELFFDYLLINDITRFKKELEKLIDLKSCTISKNSDLQQKLIFINVEQGSDNDISTDDIVKIFKEQLNFFDENKMQELYLQKVFNEKNQDFGYKTLGVNTLLEISKVSENLFSYFMSNQIVNFGDNILTNEKNSEILDLINYFYTEFILRNNLQHDNCGVEEKKINIFEKKLDNYFIYSTEYDIINAVIVINYDIIGFLGDFDLNKIDVNIDYFRNVDFIRGVYSSRMQSETHDINGFYLHISILEKNPEFAINKLFTLFSQIKFEDLFRERDVSLKYNLSINDLVSQIINNQTIVRISTDEGKMCSGLSFTLDFYLVEEDNNIKKIKSEMIKLIHLPITSTTEIKTIANFESELFKNVLVLKLIDKCDFMYLELIIETLLNERLYPKIRLSKGAYDVGYKILKLENKVVLYSSVDKFSESTLNVFEKELKKIDELTLESFKKYINKITNNFYRNEQNKNIKIKKIFDNYLLNIIDTISEFDEDEFYIALNAIKSAEIEYKLSFGKESYKDYKDGGIYVY